jgi:hypothetical protein
MMTEDDPKRDISRRNLELHGIYYEPEVYKVHDGFTQSTSYALSNHVDAVREVLLSFENTIPEVFETDISKEFEKFGAADIGPAWTQRPQSSAYIRANYAQHASGKRSTNWETAYKNVECCGEAAENAQRLLEDPEAEWNLFWRKEVFTLFSDEARKQPGLK